METNVVSRLKYDVYFSYRGIDTRFNIRTRLYDAFVQNKLRCFRDLEIGCEIGPGYIEAMEDPAASVIILSPHYANSTWCLEELVRLCDLSSSFRRPMIPVFYGVDPSHVRDHFAHDFERHAERYSEEQLLRWRIMCFFLAEATAASMIGLVVKWVLAELSKTPDKVGEYTVGLESRVDDLTNLIDIKHRYDVQVLVLYGMAWVVLGRRR